MKKETLGRSRLDKFLREKLQLKKNEVKLILAQRAVTVDECVITNADLIVDKFSVVKVAGKTLQRNHAIYVMLIKPAGVVSATIDDQHKTVIDLLRLPNKNQLHIVGRLDLNSTGLLLLTNDSRWSEKLTLPEMKMPKVYQVELKYPITEDYAPAFLKGMYFGFENITTKPAILTAESSTIAKVTLIEGRYHQIKRMFGRFRNPVIALHRVSIGNLVLDNSLTAGEYRLLSDSEVKGIFEPV